MKRLLKYRAVRALLCIVVFLTAMAATYNSLFFADRNTLCGGYDVHRETGPYNYYMDYVLHHGEIPFWNPLILCGMPFAANPVTAFFYPGNLLRSLLTVNPTPFKTHVGWITLMVIHLLIAGIATVRLARSHQLSYSASYTAAFVFLFSAIWVRRVCVYHFICMVAWVPVLFLLARRALSCDRMWGKTWNGLIGGLVLGVALLSGSLNIAPYLGVSVAAYAVLNRMAYVPSLRTNGAARFAKAVAGDMVFLVIAFGLGALVASALLLPGIEFASFTNRVKESGQALAFPHFQGTYRDLYHAIIRYPGLRWQPEYFRGAGIAALLFVVAGVLSRRWREVFLYGGLSLILFDCSMGRPFPIATVVEKLSPIQLIASTRAFDFALLPLGLLAGLGVDAVTRATRPLWWRGLRDAVLVAVGAVTLWSLSYLLGPNSYLAMGRVALLAPACALAVMLLASWLPRWSFWGVALAALMFTETLIWNHRYVPSIITRPNFAAWAGRYPAAERFWADNRRGIDPIQNRRLYTLRAAMHGYEPLHLSRVRNVLSSDIRGRRYERSVKDYEVARENHRGNLFLKRSFWLARQYVQGPLPPKNALFPAATTVFLPEAEQAPIRRVEMKDLPVSSVSEAAEAIHFVNAQRLNDVNRRLKARARNRKVMLPTVMMPGVHSALCLRYTSTGNALVKSIFREPGSREWQFGKTSPIHASAPEGALLELPLPDFAELNAEITIETNTLDTEVQFQEVYLAADRADENALINILSRSANSVELSVGELKDFRVLTVLDAAYPGWTAYIDGEKTPILVANDAFKAVAVPPGTHHVRLVFRPWRAYAGIGISIASVAGILAGIVFLSAPVHKFDDVFREGS